MKSYILIPMLVSLSCLHQSCEHEKATIIPVKQYDINLLVGNYKWSREIQYWKGSWDSTFTISDTTFPILYKNDSSVKSLIYELKLNNIDSCYNLSTEGVSSSYGASLRYSPKSKTVNFYFYTGGLGGGVHNNYTGTKIK